MPVFRCDVQRRILEFLRLLVSGLAFANQDSHHVEVAISARAPNLNQCFFDKVILSQIERQFVLTRPHFFKNVVVSLKPHKFIDHLGMSIVHGVVQGIPKSVVLAINVGTTIQQHNQALITAVLASEVQGRALQVIFLFQVSLVVKQQFYQFYFVFEGC